MTAILPISAVAARLGVSVRKARHKGYAHG